MVITFTPDGGSLITLAGGDAGSFDQPTGLRFRASGSVQETAIVRGTKPKRIHRGNVTWQGSFRVHKSYDTFDLAIAANITLAASLSEKLGSLVIKNAAGTTLKTLTQCSLEVDFSDGGAFAVRDFTFVGTAS